jgi:hypothetical protein
MLAEQNDAFAIAFAQDGVDGGGGNVGEDGNGASTLDTFFLLLVVFFVSLVMPKEQRTPAITRNYKQQDGGNDYGKCVAVCFFILFHFISNQFPLFISDHHNFCHSSSQSAGCWLLLVDCSSGCFHPSSS